MNKIKYVGLEVHKETISIAVITGNNHSPDFEKTIPNNNKQIMNLFKKLGDSKNIISSYDAGCTGFGLQRMLDKSGITCYIAAPGQIPRKSSERIKTDRRDALKIARLLKVGEIVPIYIPSKQDEYVRDYLRARGDLQIELKHNKQRLLNFLLRHEIKYHNTSYWTMKHKAWLNSLKFKNERMQDTFKTYFIQVCDLELKIAEIDKKIVKIAQQEEYTNRVARLRCFKGIDYLTALSFIVEIGDFHRFRSAGDFMAYLGIIPSEKSSGNKKFKGGITKTGNSLLRRLLIEVAWHYRHKNSVSKRLKARREGQKMEYVLYADKATIRLNNKLFNLIFKGKSKQVAVTAVAREMSGFIWGMMVDRVA